MPASSACPPKTLAAGRKPPVKKAVTATIDPPVFKGKAKPAGKAGAAKASTIKIKLDERIKGMTGEALECRHLGHSWQRIPMSGNRRLELLQRGETETIRLCTRCRSRRVDLYELPTFATLATRIEYSEGYLMLREFKGTGRLPRQAALAATIVAEVPELVGV